MLSNFKKYAAIAGSAALLAAGMGTAARADDAAPAFGYTWTVTGASDYLFRGISYTGSDPTVNSYLELTYGIGYVGFWTSNIDTCAVAGCLGPWEQDVYVGIRPVTGPVTWDLAVLYYYYEAKGISSDQTDYFEFKASGTVTPITNLSLTGTVYYTPDQNIASPENISVEGTVAYTLPAIGIFTPTVSGQFGFSDASTNGVYGTATTANVNTGLFGYWNGDDQYTYWNAGVKLAVEKFTFDIRYWDTSISDAVASNGTGPKNSDERLFFSMAVTLP